MGFWSELKRRSVVRVGGVYAVVGWLLVQVAVALEVAMGLPAWFDGMVVAVLLLGFPVALIITWAFELTPEGIKPSEAAPADAPRQPFAVIDMGFLAAMLAVLAVSAFQIMRPAQPTTVVAEAPDATADAAAPSAPAGAPAASIAVLPFTDMSPQRDQDYFSDGLSEELLNQLAHVRGLQVAGRTSSFAFKDRTASFQEIGETLGVANVLEGSVRKSGDQLRITAQLINAEDGYHIWSETYDRELDDVFGIQEEIARAVTDALSVALGVGAPQQDFGGTSSFEAYDRFLRGRALQTRGDLESIRAAEEEFRQAVAIDPDYGQGWTYLAWAFSLERSIDGRVAPQVDPQRDAAVERALATAPDAPLAMVMKAWGHIDRREWLDAYRACEAVFAAPPDLEALGLCGGLLTEVGIVRDALPYREAWVRADPLAPVVSIVLTRQYALLGMADAFEQEVERSSGIPGVDTAGGHEVWRLLMLLGEDAPRDVVAVQIDLICATWALAIDCDGLQAVAASPEDAPRLLRERLEAQRAAMPYQAYDTAWLAAYFGEDELALDAWEVFEPYGAGAYYQTIWAPLFADMRRLPRFKTFVAERGFLEVWRETGEWGDFCRPLDSDDGGEDDFECV